MIEIAIAVIVPVELHVVAREPAVGRERLRDPSSATNSPWMEEKLRASANSRMAAISCARVAVGVEVGPDQQARAASPA